MRARETSWHGRTVVRGFPHRGNPLADALALRERVNKGLNARTSMTDWLIRAVALAILMIPVVTRTTEDMLSMVPWTLREAAFALGAPYYKVIIQVVYRGAATGILTGILGTGALLASVIGTTGASMLLIRPLLRATAARRHRAPCCQRSPFPWEIRFKLFFTAETPRR